VLSGSTLVMIGMSWPLWVDGEDFPRIPFVEGWGGLTARASWVILGSIVVALGAATIGRAWRLAMGVGLVLLAFEVLGDQNRLQPWASQYGTIGLVLVVFPPATALRLARLHAISLYLYSGLSKLDASFLRELGPTFLEAGLAPLGLSPGDWPAAARTAAILAMPAGEAAIGLGLGWGSTRRAALVVAIGLHSALILILGPWGLDHSPNVLIWNGAMIAEDVLLFGSVRTPAAVPGNPGRLGPLSRFLAVAFFLFPLGERFGIADSWPSHALYASHSERAEVFLHEDALDRFPDSIRRRVAGAGEGPWRRLDLTGWSRDLRGTPLYPQGRVGNGMGEWLAARLGGPPSVRVVLWGRAGPLDGGRDRVECIGLRAIRRRGDRFRINAHPSGGDRP